MNVSEGVKRFYHRNKGVLAVVTLLLLFLLLFFFPSIFITVYPGEVGVKFNRLFGGTVRDKIYPDGLYVIFPWDRMYRYDVRVQGFQQTVYMLTSYGLNLEVDVAVRFRPEMERLPELHLRVGPQYLEKVVIPMTISSVRQVLGKYTPEEIYSTEAERLQDQILQQVVEQTGRVPIVYDSLVIERILLPPLIREAIEKKLLFQQQMLAYEFRLEAERKEIERKMLEAEGIAKYNVRVRESLTGDLLTWKGITATTELAASNNAKVVIIGSGKGGLPVILNLEGAELSAAARQLDAEQQSEQGPDPNPALLGEQPPAQPIGQSTDQSVDQPIGQPAVRLPAQSSPREFQMQAPQPGAERNVK